MLKDALSWYFMTYSEEFRQGKEGAFELVMFGIVHTDLNM